MPTIAEEFSKFALWFEYDPGFSQDFEWLGLNVEDRVVLECVILERGRNSPMVRDSGDLWKMRFSPVRWNVGENGATRVLFVQEMGHG